jgi:O-antigen ligase
VQSAAPGIAINIFKTRNFLFFVAVLLMHWTLLRPAPADVVFMAVLYLSIVLNPTLNSRFLVFALLVLVWTFSIFISSIHVIDVSAVQFQLLAHTFVVLLGLTACFVALSWGEVDFHSFLKVYLVACCISACLGIYGFAANVDYLLWDGRAKALFDEPIAFGAFLLPGVLGAMYLLSRGEGRVFPFTALALCIVGVLLSFSRAAIFSLFAFAPLYFIVLHRRNLAKAGGYLLIAVVIASAILLLAFLSSDGFQAKVLDRLTVSKDYDVGQGGRFSRYFMSIPMILENPLGLGMLQIEKYFTEPVHDIFISSFVNYGWLAGVAWILLTLLTFRIAFDNQRATQSPLAMWLSFSLLSQLPCAILQQVEHWRHMWMFLGLLWGFNARNFSVAATAMNRTPLGAPPRFRMERS